MAVKKKAVKKPVKTVAKSMYGPKVDVMKKAEAKRKAAVAKKRAAFKAAQAKKAKK